MSQAGDSSAEDVPLSARPIKKRHPLSKETSIPAVDSSVMDTEASRDESDRDSEPLSPGSGHESADVKAETPTDVAKPEPGSMPVQKRRRVTRACDECRRKKIKCDGKQPCTHCSVYSYGIY